MNKAYTLLLLVVLVGNAHAQKIFHKADSLADLSQYDKAIQVVDLSLSEISDLKIKSLLQNKKAEVLLLQGKTDDAEQLLNSINKSDAFVHAVTLSTLGALYLNKGRSDIALDDLKQSIDLFQSSGNQNTVEAARCLSYLGSVYWSTGRYNQAEENDLIALQIRQKLLGEKSEEVAASYNDLGLVYAQTDPDKALEYYEKALATYETIHGKEHRKIAIAYTNIGTMYRKTELYGDAINNFEDARKIWEKLYPEGHPNLALVLSNLGQTYNQMGNRATAKEFFEKALAIYKKYYGEKHYDIATILNQLGSLQLSDQHYDAAIDYFQKAIIANAPDFNNGDYKKNPSVKGYYNGEVLLYSLMLKSQSLEMRHYRKTLKFEDLKLALSSLYSCDSLIDDIRHHSTDENDKLALGELANEVYEDGVRIAESMSEITLSSPQYKEAAFYFAEKSKSAVLQESIADTQAKSFAGIPQELLEKEKNIKASIAYLVEKLSQKPSADEEAKLRESLFNENLLYNQFIQTLEKQYPDYYNLKFNQSSVSIAQIQKSLSKQTAFVSFFIAEKNKRIYQFIITKDHFKLKNLTLPDDFDRKIKGLTNSLFYSDAAVYKNTAPILAKVLLPSLPPAIKELVIIPSGRLGTLPFEVLPYKKIPSASFEGTPYLIKKYAVGYEFSAGLFVQTSKSAQHQGASSIFLCAPVQFPEKDNLNDLPGTEKEVNTIGNLFAGKNTIASFDKASETLVKSKSIGDYNYLHFATHGIVDEVNPESSRIFLNNDAKEDGNLYAGEIYNIALNADLVVLSACQTGLGKFSKGEGVIGLSRALVYAGARNIVVSFWSVADESTAQLMTDFYTDLLQQKSDFRVALQQAKIKMIQDKQYASPYYWAPFILIGN